MSFQKFILVALLISIAVSTSSAQENARARRDPKAVEILTRTLNAAGGSQALAAVRDLSETGEITFYWGDNVKGPVMIRTLGGNHFRMEADLPEGKIAWIVRNGIGLKKDGEKVSPISHDNAVNLCNLTYPAGHIAAALDDLRTEVSLVGIEQREGRSLYRMLARGKLGIIGDDSPASVAKELVVDALTFDIVSIYDHPYSTYTSDGSNPAPREIDFDDFRVVNGVRLPFSISTKLQGQPTLTIKLSSVTVNTNASANDFQIQN